MPEVQAELVIEAPVARVYELAKQVERLPEFLPSLERVTIQLREGNRTISEWVGLIPEFRRKIAWVEEDLWDDEARRCEFRSVSGDWDRYEGVWTFAERGDRTEVSLSISYQYDVPLIGALIRKLLHKLVERSARETLEGLRKMAAESDG
ncbi:MAG: type II toxin-antitoxin system RatA family toxin [Armatimonadota bacterium]